jgi:carboxyl-terminal processing protease
VQNIVELERGKSALKLTTASYLRPSGKNIHRAVGAAEADDWGVQPDDGYAVPYSDRESHELSLHLTQLDTAAQLPDGTAGTGEDQGPTDGTAAFVDRQLDKALEYVRGRLPAPQAAAPPDHADSTGS